MSRANLFLMWVAGVGLGAMLVLPGCSAAPGTDPDLRPIYTAGGEARSLVADSPALVAAPPRDGLPWYHDRNDRGTTLIAGYQSPTLLGATTRTHDHLHSSPHGRVHDHYSQRTDRYQTTEGMR